MSEALARGNEGSRDQGWDVGGWWNLAGNGEFSLAKLREHTTEPGLQRGFAADVGGVEAVTKRRSDGETEECSGLLAIDGLRLTIDVWELGIGGSRFTGDIG